MASPSVAALDTDVVEGDGDIPVGVRGDVHDLVHGPHAAVRADDPRRLRDRFGVGPGIHVVPAGHREVAAVAHPGRGVGRVRPALLGEDEVDLPAGLIDLATTACPSSRRTPGTDLNGLGQVVRTGD